MLPQNWPAFRCYAASRTQWRYTASGHATGLDYAGCRQVARALGYRWRDVFPGLQIMEDEALEGRASRGEPPSG